MEPTREQIEKQLQRILKSNKFRRSQTNIKLLKYLVTQSIEGKHPNELKIGIEVFNKSYSENEKTNANTRVYVYNLREKLKNYYLEEGSWDEIIFEIQKGDYFILFKWNPQVNRIHDNKSFKVPFYILTVAFVVTLLSCFIFFVPKKSEFKNAPIWNQFYENDLPVLLVFGDYYLMESETLIGEDGIIRDRNINSNADFNDFLHEYPNLIDKVKPAPFSFLAKSAPVCLSMIQPVILDIEKKIQIKVSSEIQISDFKNYNVIFIGAYKSKQPIDNILYSMKMKYNIVESSRNYLISNDKNATTYEIFENDIKKEDYGVVLNFESLAGNKYLFFLSSESAGNISLVRLFTDKKLLNKFYEEHIVTLGTNQFKALYQISGLKTTDFSNELIRVDSLNYK